MGKKLHTGRYTFDAANSEITLKGNINPERLLLITNVTDNVIIYSFAEVGKGYAGKFYNTADNTTIIQLDYDCSSMSDSDFLQIFIEEEDTSFMPAESLLDPVGKLRVSNPGNLIDTDFEYGLQASKWETLQTVSNIPTIYSTSGDLPLEGVSTVTAVNGSKSVKVTTTLPHGLSIGDPISVQGLTLYQAEGFFIVSSVSSTTEFFFSMDVESNVTGEIQGSYTSIIPAKFFEGSTVPVSSVDGAQTDGASPSSSIDVTTTQAHGFAAGTKVYVRNSVGPKSFTVPDPSTTAEDGRPTVDTQETFDNTFPITSSTDTGRGAYRTSAVVAYDWEATYTQYIGPSDINTTNDTITWNNHNLSSSYALLFNTPRRGDTDGGMTDGSVYFTEIVDSNTIKLHNNETLTSTVNLTTLNNTYGLARLGLVYVVEQSVGTEKRTTFYQASQVSDTAQTGLIQGSPFPNTNVFTEINLTNLLGFNPTTANIDSMTLAGDVNTSNENVDFFIVNEAGTILQSIFNVYSPGNQSANQAASTFPSTDITNFTYTRGGDTFVRIRHDCETSVNNFIFGNGQRLYELRFTISGTETDPTVNGSGKDLLSSAYGLGSQIPTRVLAFQGFTSNSYTFTLDTFSSISSQKNNGRYGTANILTNNSITLPTQDGTFDLDISTPSWNAGTSSQIVYVFARLLSADRNTIFSTSHGIDDTGGITGKLVIPSSDYASGARFKFHDGDNNMIQIDREEIPININVTSPDTVRVQPTISPNTDDIASFPDEFSLVYDQVNPNFNTIYIKNHKINADTTATYTTGSGAGATIDPLNSGDSVILQRVNDNRVRLNLGDVEGEETVAASTTAIGNASNGVSNWFVNLEDLVGYAPTSAEITGIEFRGDFSGTNEYVTITFDDSSTHDVGRTGGQDTSTFLTDNTWSTKDISSILTTSGGKVGFNISADPTVAVNFAPFPMTNWWEIVFIVNTEKTAIIINASSTGSGEQIFSVNNLVGAYDGIFEITSIPTTTDFIIESDFSIPTREYEFTSSQVNTTTNVIDFPEPHNFITGEKVIYNSGSNSSIIPAGTDQTYVITLDSGSIRLAGSEADALQNVGLSLSSPTGTHSLQSNNVIKSLPGSGTVSTTNGSLSIIGDGTNFLTDFKRFDKIYIETSTYVKAFTVDTITTEENMTLFEDPGETLSDVQYFYATQITLKPDGFAKHLPFDGGVDITAGTSPNSKIIRQTRKYFRYQSGKGIQNSFAINFNPPRLVKDLIQSTGTTAIVNTQEAHNLTVGDEVRIEGATVTTGINQYNGTFTVTTVPSPFRFTYTMAATPSDNRAGGFPTYTRTSWTDAFVRAGMFDDQNGFFYEYDGQKLYAVRRSSTAQTSGTISATRGSQTITGVGTSFTSQFTPFGFIVIRGQSYQVVQIKSDTEAVIQPAYKGVSASNIRTTITVDTRVPQEEWNIDKCDGTGPFGFVLDVNKIQMGYADYSWYGAGKIRFGFKDQFGHIIYVHEFIHNNILQESYFRSGNLPGRYEIANGPRPTHSPTLFHFGTSVIMDGRFDDDKAYQFTAFSKPFAFTNGGSRNITSTGDSTFEIITLNGRRVYVYAIPVSANDAGATVVGTAISDSNSYLGSGAYVAQVKVDGVNSKIYASTPGTTSDPTGTLNVIANADTITLGETTAIDLTRPLPLVSIRLAPSVDNGLTGPVGEREVINRMQLALRSAGVTANQDIEVFIILNALPSEILFEDAQKPSLSELLRHNAGDTLLDGTTIYSEKVSDGSVSIDLTALLEIGNSILGGDSIFPAGPDLLTLAVQPQDTAGITSTTPFFVSGKVSWSESQA
jgi:hypothetical protein